MANGAIKATGSYVPDHAVHNEALGQFPKAAQLLISQKTGVISRHHAGQDQCTSDLALPAARLCLERSDLAPGKVEAIKRYRDMGMRAFILSGYPHHDECELFARYVLPKLSTCKLNEVQGRRVSHPETPLTTASRPVPGRRFP